MADIFISYAREDIDKVRPLAKAFEKKGWTVWWDPEIRSGTAFDRVIEEALEEAKSVVVVWSHNSLKSDWVRAEASYGLERGILISLALEWDLRPPLRFLNIHTERLIDWNGEKSSSVFDKIVADIRAILGRIEPLEEAKRIEQEHRGLSDETRIQPQKESDVKPRIRPELDSMVKVIAGEFIYQNGTDRSEKPYLIDIYPVTNIQYEKFIKAGGYSKDQYWRPEGKDWRNKLGVIEPRYWDDEKWSQPEHPVVGVSFYEVEAYAKWSGKRLPKEKEWERAACGTDGRKYPWGDDFVKERCNTHNTGIGKTTRVGRYRTGISPAGCYDMTGNVWEWTSSWYNDQKIEKVLRGCSWNNRRTFAACTVRFKYPPTLRFNDLGFRCVKDTE
jgi:hypothetical protein